MRKLSTLTLFAAALAVLPPAGAGELVIGTTELPRNFNPYFEYNQIEHVINDLVYDALMAHVAIHRDPDRAYLPNLASALQPRFTDPTDFDGTFQVRLRQNVRSQRSPAPLSIDDLRQTLNGIRAVPENLYHGRKITLAPDPARPEDFFLTVGHPRVGGDEAALLYIHLTFPIVRLPEDAHQLIDSPGQEHYIDGFGPYRLEKYDLTENKITLTRFDAHHQAKADLAPASRVQQVVISFVDKQEDLTAGFRSGRFDVLLNHVGQLPGRYDRDPSPTLNSFTYLGFNRNESYRGQGQELFEQQSFRQLVWHSLNEDVYEIFTSGRGERLYSLQKLANPDNRRFLVAYGREYDDDRLRREIDEFFTGRPHLRNKKLSLKCKGFVPYHCDLANRIHRRLTAMFGDYISFGPSAVPVAQEPTWNRDVVANKQFDMLVDTFYYGVNAKILSLSFFSQQEAGLNLTGTIVNRRPYVSMRRGREMITDYDRFLIDVNTRAEVIVLGSFRRSNFLNSSRFEVRRAKNAPLLHNVQNWKVLE